MRPDVGALRTGEFARRVDVSPELLRAWERRYGLLQPTRTEGRFRLYSTEDADRVARMKRGLAEGLSAAEAARQARVEERPAGGLLDDASIRLLRAAHDYDEVAVQAVLDEAIATFGCSRPSSSRIDPASAERDRRPVGARRTRGRPGALRVPPHPRATARSGSTLGSRERPAGDPRLRARRATRHQPARLRPRPSLVRLASSLPRCGHAPRDSRPRRCGHRAADRRRLELRRFAARRGGHRTSSARSNGAARALRPGRLRRAVRTTSRRSARR